MIALFVSVIFYVVDPYLGIILALTLPSVIGSDMSGTNADLLVSLLWASAMLFVRRSSFGKDE